MTVRTRFAPSPTGTLHVGSIRTALYAWLYAKRHKGQFILRIEDTDRERSSQASVDAILEGMQWLGLDYDEGPYYQTKRLERYQQVINQLLEKGLAYRCICSKDRLDALRETQMQAKQKPKYDGCCRGQQIEHTNEPFVIRFKNPLEGVVTYLDAVYGEITVANSELDDLVILKSDGMPTYNLAVVVDDIDMAITHVIRGDDHINNTPRQINLYKALGANIPEFSHLPMILGDDGKRLSKRHGAVNVMQFKEDGYLAQTLLNYLVRLGWSHGDQEIFSVDEMIQYFDLNHISRGGSSFSFDKLNWLNQHYLKHTDVNELIKTLLPFYKAKGVNLVAGPDLKDVIPEYVERCKTLVEIVEKTAFVFEDEIKYDEKAVQKQLKPNIIEPLKDVLSKFNEVTQWQAENLHQIIDEVAASFELKMPKIAQPLRVAVTGSTMSPSIDITLQWIGKDKVLQRIKSAIELIPKED